MELKKIKVKDLLRYCESEEFKSFPIKPISPLRVKSFIHNPRAEQDDFALYLLIEKGAVVSFSMVFGDAIVEGNKRIRFCWRSGVWTHPDFRGKRLWKKILDEVLIDWDGKIMVTNYAPIIKKLYLETGLFSLFFHREGKRFYLYPDFNKLLKARGFYGKVKYFLPLFSFLISSGSYLKNLLSSTKSTIQHKEITIPDIECWEFVENNEFFSTFNRGSKEIQWIYNYPWVSSEEHSDLHFPFSSANIDYDVHTIKVYEKGNLIGFFIYTLTDRHLKVPYYYCVEGKLIKVSELILSIALKNKISHLTILDSHLADAVKTSNNCFIYHKTFSSHVYATFGYDGLKNIYDGDGDNIFT